METSSAHDKPLPPVLRDKVVVVLGAGKVGSAVAALLGGAGLVVAAVTTRSVATAEPAAALVGAEPGTDNAAAAKLGDIVLVTTNDDAIAGVVAEAAEKGAFRPGQLVMHMSGALPLSVLAPAAEAGAAIGCAHPMQSFATAQDALRLIGGSVFGITSGPGAAELLGAVVGVLGGQAVVVADANKVLYHAAAVVASNYLVALEDVAAHLLVEAGFDEESALAALQPLVSGTVGNIGALGTTNALTGPIVRGDVDTVRRHTEALRDLSGGELELYRTLGRRTVEIARRRGQLDAETIRALLSVLAEEPGERD